ncbi:MAG: hypothetical protein A2020_04615 [Lentisphaerae bacterium GWF2_45_14]|nr:MAG: hypothetical protein A2020_04615 [Lentisphaerae bacterium GWF2_45_14]
MITYDEPWLKKGETLLCFGDSITAAAGGYVKLLGDKLAELDIKVINAGRGGDKTPTALTRFQKDVLDIKPSAVSIYLGANDSAVGRGRWADEPQVSPEAYKYNLIWMAHLCRLSGINKLSIAPPAWKFEADAYAEHGDIMAPYCLAAREASDRMLTRFVPLDKTFSDEWAKHPGHTGLLLTTDGVHMTAKGNALITETMLKAWGISS